MLASYGLIVRHLCATRMRANDTSTSFTHSISRSAGGSQKKRRKPSVRSNKVRRRVTIMCAALVISCMVCWVPFHAIHLAKFYGIPNQSVSSSACAIVNHKVVKDLLN